MNRRSLLTAALAAPALAVPAAAATETPVMALFRQWKAHNDWINGPEMADLDNQAFDALCDDDMDMIRQIIRTPAVTAQDLCAKLLAVTEFGAVISYIGLEGVECLPLEADRLVA